MGEMLALPHIPIRQRVQSSHSFLHNETGVLRNQLQGSERVTASQDRKRLGDECWRKPLNLVRGVFDLEVRRKPQAFAAVAVISLRCMDIECSLVID